MSDRDLKRIPGIKLDGEEPVFAEPWEAEAFALVVAMHGKGLFDWSEWAQMLGETIRKDIDDTPYYCLWLRALEEIVAIKGMVTASEFAQREADWKRALAATPHGKPIELSNATQ